MHFLSLSFASFLITIWNPARIYLYLDLFLLKFLFISKSSEWVLTSRFSPMTPSLHSLNVKEYISLISQVLTCAAWVTTLSQNLIFHVLILRRPTGLFFFFSPNLRWQQTISGEAQLLTATKDLCLTLAQSPNRSLQHNKHYIPCSNDWTITQSHLRIPLKLCS